MPIANIGSTNVSALNVPQALIQIVPPQSLFNGVATNVCGLVGTSPWGPVNLPTPFGSYAQYAAIFGPTINRLGDMGGHVQLAVAQGAGAFVGVRVTDGTDTAATAAVASTGAAFATDTITFTTNPAASATLTVDGTVWTFVSAVTAALQILIQANLAATLAVAAATLNASTDANTSTMTFAATATTLVATAAAVGTGGNALTLATTVSGATPASGTLSGGAAGTTGVTLTGRFTGSLGNSILATVQKGGAANSWRVVISCPSLTTEIFDNLAAGLTGNAIWIAIANAINNGSSTVRPPSNIVIATAGGATGLPLVGVTKFAAGTDGASGVTTSTLLGVNSLPRTGMFALGSQGVAQFTLCDLSDTTAFSSIAAFALGIGAYAIQATPPSDTLANAQTELSQMGIDTPYFKPLFGDWIIWTDTVNNVPQRMTSPAAMSLGFFGNASPQVNSLNKPLNGAVGTQSLLLGKAYSYSDLQTLSQARMDVITIDLTLSNNLVHRLGINSSSNQVTAGDEYTRVVTFLAKSIQVIASPFIGSNMTPTEMTNAKVALQQFLQLAQNNGIIYTFNGSQPYQVVLDNSNNSQATAALGYQYAFIKVIIGPIVRYFIINLEAGSSVTISNTPPGA